MSAEQVHPRVAHRIQIDGIHAKQRPSDLRKATIAVLGLERQGLSLLLRAAPLEDFERSDLMQTK